MTGTETYCDACGRRDSWGCGHTSSQRRDARRHKATKAHIEGRCMCYGHDNCDPAECRHAGQRVGGYVPFVQHADIRSVAV